MGNTDKHLCTDEGSQKTTAKIQEMTPTGPVAKIGLEGEKVDHTESGDTWLDLSNLVMELRELRTRTGMGRFCADNAQPCLLGHVSSNGCRVCGPFTR